MIRIRIDIVPGGNEKRAFQQAGAEILCMPSERPHCDCAVTVGESQNPCVPRLDWTAFGHVRRPDGKTVWALVEKVAKFAVIEAEKSDS